jgi:hypothetical protein
MNSIPTCTCGASRVFEVQLLPSLLHVLQVDKYADATSTGLDAAYEQGGMDWGNIAIYSCPNACSADEEYVVIQGSDERPTQNSAFQGDTDVLIPEDSKFDDGDDGEEDDGSVEEEEEEDVDEE